MSDIPLVVSGPNLQIKRTVEYDLPCPKCSKDMRVTAVKEGAIVECRYCKNVTWRIGYKPPWWAKTWAFVLSILIALTTGVISSIIYDFYKEARNPVVSLDSPSRK
jgi:hypothetical protein